MKVLWFANNPCGSIRRNGCSSTLGGWLVSLEDAIKQNDDIDLSVCYISDTDECDFVYDDVHYYPVFDHHSSTRVKRVIKRFKNRYSADNNVLSQLLSVVASVRPQLIHIHGTEECFSMIQRCVKDIPVVVSIQGILSSCIYHFYSGISLSEVIKYESLKKRIKILSYYDDYLDMVCRADREKDILSISQNVIGRTDYDKFIVKLFNGKVNYFHCDEVLRSPFYSNKWDKDSFSDRIVIYSTLSDSIYKGFETVLSTAKSLKDSGSIDFEWVVSGLSSRSESVRISEKTLSISSSDVNVRCVGMKTAEEISSLILHSDIYVQSSHIENSSNSLCEAMILGIPIVATFAGGTSSMLRDGKEGILVQDGDPCVLAGAIISLLSDFDTARRLGICARERAVVRHSPERIAGDILSIYKSVLTK